LRLVFAGARPGLILMLFLGTLLGTYLFLLLHALGVLGCAWIGGTLVTHLTHSAAASTTHTTAAATAACKSNCAGTNGYGKQSHD
jgi:hypothetical protein